MLQFSWTMDTQSLCHYIRRSHVPFFSKNHFEHPYPRRTYQKSLQHFSIQLPKQLLPRHPNTHLQREGIYLDPQNIPIKHQTSGSNWMYRATWRIIPVDGSVVHNHGDRKSPNCFFSFQMTFLWLINGMILTTYKSWDDPSNP